MNQISAKLSRFWQILGPGLVTGASDDDPSGIATYSQAGAAFGLSTLWTALITFPLMASIQEMCARIGLVTSHGLAGTLRANYSKPVLYLMLVFNFPAIVMNISADIAGMGAVGNLLIPSIPSAYFSLFFTALLLVLIVYLPYGINYPPQFEKSGSHWSKRFMKWLSEEASLQHDSGTLALRILVQEAEQQRKLLFEVLRKIRLLSCSEKYERNVALFRTIPGIGLITAIVFLTEIENIERFENTDHFAGFVGLVPNYHSSGERANNGEMTFRGHNTLRKSLIESSWFAARFDPALMMSYHSYIRRMEPNKAIVRIARKVLNRMYYVLKNKMEYVPGVVK